MDEPASHRRRSVEYLKCAAHPGYFLHEFCTIEDTQGRDDGGVIVPFRLWPAQMRLLLAIASGPLVFILKARQLGISWLVCGYALWMILFQPGRLVLLLSQGQDEAMELLRRVVSMYDRLPPWFSEYLPRPTVNNTTRFELANGSRVLSLPATKKAGSGYTASLVVMDEFAKLPWPDETFTAVKPTIDAGGQLIILSTAQGVGNLFHDLWVRFSAGLTRWKTFFLSWRDRPGRDQAWYDRTLAESNDPAKHKQEYPGSPLEAFQVSGYVRFPEEWIAAQHARALPPLTPRDFDYPRPLADLDGLVVYQGPVATGDVTIGADVAEGGGGDYSAATVVQGATGAELAHLHGHWEPNEFAEKLARVAQHYDATIVVERNNHGHAILLRLAQLCPDRVARGHDGKPGWLTNATTKPQAIDFLAAALRDGSISVRTPATLAEMANYLVTPGGGTSAPSGKHDDRVMSWAVLLGWLKLGSPAAGPVAFGPNPARGHRGSRSHR